MTRKQKYTRSRWASMLILEREGHKRFKNRNPMAVEIFPHARARNVNAISMIAKKGASEMAQNDSLCSMLAII